MCVNMLEYWEQIMEKILKISCVIIVFMSKVGHLVRTCLLIIF